MGVLGSTAALARGGQAAAMELPVMQLDTPRPWASRIDRRSAARRAGGGDGAAGDAARRDAAMDVVESTAALLRGEQAAAMELPVMQLDTTRPPADPRARTPAPAAGALPAIARRACSDVSCDVRASDTCTDCSDGSTWTMRVRAPPRARRPSTASWTLTRSAALQHRELRRLSVRLVHRLPRRLHLEPRGRVRLWVPSDRVRRRGY